MDQLDSKACQIAIVVIAYNRLDSLRRLIESLLCAEYLGDRVDLIVSIDNSGTTTLVEYATSVAWPHGEKKIIAHESRLGLKRHVLKCGELTNDYEHLCVLEDDLYVSPGFYAFAKQASDHFERREDIAGISLYSHQWNPYVNRPFSAIEDRYDVFLLQVASSWGQVWSREKWRNFLQWMEGKTDQDLHSDSMPSVVSGWSTKSWLKFHNRYLVDAKKYFVYPRQSLVTNFSDRGEHANVTATYQVPLLLDVKKEYKFPEEFAPSNRYDAFFENEGLAESLGIVRGEVDISLYENRVAKKRYLLTTKILDFHPIRTFGLKLRPIDVNVILGMKGAGIYLYDTKVKAENPASCLRSIASRFVYEMKSESRAGYLLAAIVLYARAVRVRIGF